MMSDDARYVETRVEKHVIREINPYYQMLRCYCHRAKNLYNRTNFVVRHQFIENNKWLRYFDLDKMIRSEFIDYRLMPTAQTAQQLIKNLDAAWSAFFRSIKDWSKNKDKYNGKPKMPKYLKTDGYYPVTIPNQACKIKNGVLNFPRAFYGFQVHTKCQDRSDFISFQQIRIVPKMRRVVIEVIYKIRVVCEKTDNGRYIGIDTGVDNLAAAANNFGAPAFVVNGRPVKSINQFYNKMIAHYSSVTKMMNHRDFSKRMQRIAIKRSNKLNDYLHKASRYIVDWCAEHDVCKIIIGKNVNMKNGISLSHKVNQSFVQIPFYSLISMIQYKAREIGVAVVTTEESYTSGTSFIDDEMPVKENYNNKRRVHRGLFMSNDGISINADLNGAYQIMKKVVQLKWDSGCASHPVVVCF